MQVTKKFKMNPIPRKILNKNKNESSLGRKTKKVKVSVGHFNQNLQRKVSVGISL